MADSTEPEEVSLKRMIAEFAQFIPHNQALGISIVSMDDGVARLVLPYRPELVGNPETGGLHGGAITTLLDAATGLAVFLSLKQRTSIATLDLRVDYLKATPARAPVFATAECYKTTRNIAFARGYAHLGNEDDPIASVVATFMLETRMS